jgi:asparagine synthase (glutamine-hydrolysing)
MCGIAGLLGPPEGLTDAGVRADRMIRTLEHRGPDGYGLHSAGAIALAHARLSIIDLATGDQPIYNEDRSVVTVFNGEIFNYRELRDELVARGHAFATHSDTEVIVHAYEQYGLEFPRHLIGQFAIALWDSRADRLVLARDHTGIRPLFVARAGDTLLFASEIKALHASGLVGAALDPIGLAQAFSFWAPLAPRTAFAGVEALQPGELLVVERGRTERRRFWRWSFPAHGEERTASFAASAEELRALLQDAVDLQLRADVEVGSYLSGGLDSSAISALAARRLGRRLRTFSIGFVSAEFDERPHQLAMAAHIGSDHECMEVHAERIGAALPRAVWHAEAPLVRTAAVPLMLLSARVRAAGLKVVLTGEGADEIFGGYDLFKEAAIRRFWARQPQSRARPQLLRRLYGYVANSPTASRGLYTGFFGQDLGDVQSPSFAHRTRWDSTYRIARLFTPDLRSAVAGWEPSREYEATLPDEAKRWSPLARDQYAEAMTLLPGYLLAAQGDRVAMANSVEARYPFLDHRVVEFANALPPTYKLRGLAEKRILKAAMEPLVPDSIRARVKQPYRSPDGASLFADGRPLPYVEHLLSEPSLRSAGLFDPAAVGLLVKKFAAGKAIGFGDNMALVGVVTAMILHERFVLGRAL